MSDESLGAATHHSSLIAHLSAGEIMAQVARPAGAPGALDRRRAGETRSRSDGAGVRYNGVEQAPGPRRRYTPRGRAREALTILLVGLWLTSSIRVLLGPPGRAAPRVPPRRWIACSAFSWPSTVARPAPGRGCSIA